MIYNVHYIFSYIIFVYQWSKGRISYTFLVLYSCGTCVIYLIFQFEQLTRVQNSHFFTRKSNSNSGTCVIYLIFLLLLCFWNTILLWWYANNFDFILLYIYIIFFSGTPSYFDGMLITLFWKPRRIYIWWGWGNRRGVCHWNVLVLNKAFKSRSGC